MTIFRFAIKRSFRRIPTLIALCVVPALMIFVGPLWAGTDADGPTVYGIVVLYTAYLIVRTVMTDRVGGTIVRIYSAPVTPLGYLSENLLAAMVLVSAQIVIMIAAGTLLYRWSLMSALTLWVCYTVFGACAVGFSLAWVSLFRSRDLSDAVFSIVVSFMTILGGIFMPLAILPGVFEKIGMLFPVYWFTNAVMRVQGNAEAQYGYWVSLAVLAIYTGVFLVFGGTRRLD
jgi:ABC-2 type transport system permease protein